MNVSKFYFSARRSVPCDYVNSLPASSTVLSARRDAQGWPGEFVQAGRVEVGATLHWWHSNRSPLHPGKSTNVLFDNLPSLPGFSALRYGFGLSGSLLLPVEVGGLVIVDRRARAQRNVSVVASLASKLSPFFGSLHGSGNIAVNFGNTNCRNL